MGKPPPASAITRTKKTQNASTQRYGDGIVTPRISKPMLMLMLCGSSGRSAFSCLAQYRHHAEVNASGGDVLLLRSRYSRDHQLVSSCGLHTQPNGYVFFEFDTPIRTFPFLVRTSSFTECARSMGNCTAFSASIPPSSLSTLASRGSLEPLSSSKLTTERLAQQRTVEQHDPRHKP